jgi:uncharacterized protein
VDRKLPSDATALTLLETAGCSNTVITHCKAVAALATDIAEACNARGMTVDVDLVRIGALLHDIGRSKTHGVGHGIVGAQIAKVAQLPDAVVAIIEHHVGSGITKKEAQSLGFPAKSYVPRSMEERIVAYADKLIEGARQVSIEAAVERFRRDKQISDEAVQRLKQWHKQLAACTP